MAIFQANALPYSGTTAAFDAWITILSQGLDAIGMAKTADTGQISLSVAFPTLGTYAGYEIRHFTDSNANTVYFKIEYGSSGGVAAPIVRIQFGNGSNGSGTLTGNLSAQYVVQCAGQSTTISQPFWVSGSTNWFTLGTMSKSTAVGSFGIGAARSQDATGADTSTAISAHFACGNATVAFKTSIWLPASGGGAEIPSTSWLSGFPAVGGSASTSAAVDMWEVWPNISNVRQPWDRLALVACASDMGANPNGGTTQTWNSYSAAHTYVANGYFGTAATMSVNGNTVAIPTICWRYE